MAQNVIKSNKSIIEGWSKTTSSKMEVFYPTNKNEVIEFFRFIKKNNFSSSIISGKRSYSDNYLNTHYGMSTMNLKKIFEIDEVNKTITVEAGVLFEDLLKYLEQNGYLLPVMPGTGKATISGGLINNIHGKNAFKKGFIGNHIQSFEFLNFSNFRYEEANRNKNSELFYKAISGLGVTVVVSEVTLNIEKNENVNIEEDQIRCENFKSLIDNINQNKNKSDYLIASLDLSSRTNKKYLAKLSLGKFTNTTKEKVSFNIFKFLSNLKIVRFVFQINILYKIVEEFFGYYSAGRILFKKKSLKKLSEYHFLNDHFIPNYNLLFKNGFFEYQCIIPLKDAESFFDEFKKLISKFNIRPLMSGVKLYKPSTEKFNLSLQLECEALAFTFDFQNSKNAVDLFKLLNKKVIDYKGKVYYAKTACLNYDDFSEMYGETNIDELKKIKKEYDPDNLITNNLFDRIINNNKTYYYDY